MNWNVKLDIKLENIQFNQPLLSHTGDVVPFILSCNHNELTMMLSWVCGLRKTAKRQTANVGK